MIKIDLDNDKQVNYICDYFKNEALENKIEEKDKEIENMRRKWYDDSEEYLLEIERLNNILDTLMQDMTLLNATGKKEIKPKYVFDRIVMLREGNDKECKN